MLKAASSDKLLAVVGFSLRWGAGRQNPTLAKAGRKFRPYGQLAPQAETDQSVQPVSKNLKVGTDDGSDSAPFPSTQGLPALSCVAETSSIFGCVASSARRTTGQ